MDGGRTRYIHGTAPDEQRRLSRLNELINGASLSRLRIRAGERVLDLGCGMGQLTRAMARVGASQVVGVEWSETQIAEGERQGGTPAGVDVRQGDAAAPPLREDEWGTFDLVHTRFLLEHLPRPEGVIEVMVRAVKPGGRLVIEDDDHELLRLHPAVPSFERIWRAYMDTYRTAGCDPEIGRRLPRMLADAGAAPMRCDWPFFGACHGSGGWDVITSNCRAIVSGARDAIRDEGVDAAAFDAGLADYDAWRAVPGAAFWYCTFWVEAIRPR